jgi:hypothetical protein
MTARWSVSSCTRPLSSSARKATKDRHSARIRTSLASLLPCIRTGRSRRMNRHTSVLINPWRWALLPLIAAATLAVTGSATTAASIPSAEQNTFTKWVTTAPSMAGVVGGAVGDGSYAGQILKAPRRHHGDRQSPAVPSPPCSVPCPLERDNAPRHSFVCPVGHGPPRGEDLKTVAFHLEGS